MGADGHIKIWRDDEAREAFPDCDELFECLPTHYVDNLDGVKYHHCYWGDNLWVQWDEVGDWYLFGEKDTEENRARLKEFCEWLHRNGTHWEVWT